MECPAERENGPHTRRPYNPEGGNSMVQANQMNSESFTNGIEMTLRRIAGHSDFNRKRNSFAPHGYFAGRPIIGEYSNVTGGVFIGAVPHEAIVIDEEHGELEKTYTQFTVRLAELQKAYGIYYQQHIFPELVDFVSEVLKWDAEALNALHRKKNIKVDQKVALDMYVREGVGAARHQVLLACYILEKLKLRGLIKGCWFIDMNISLGTQYRVRLNYIDTHGQTFSLDPRRNYRERLHHKWL